MMGYWTGADSELRELLADAGYFDVSDDSDNDKPAEFKLPIEDVIDLDQVKEMVISWYEKARDDGKWYEPLLEPYPDWEGVSKQDYIILNAVTHMLDDSHIQFMADKLDIDVPAINGLDSIVEWLDSLTLQQLEDVGI